MDEPVDLWFAREILVHESALMRYLLRAWPQQDEIHDLRQDIYVRVYEAADRSRPTQPKAFLFTVARHLLTDRLRRGRIVSIEAVGDPDELNVLVDEISPERRLSARQMLGRLAEAFDRLPDRCRQVIWLRRVEDMPQKAIAAALGISEKTVEKQIAKGTRLIADYFYGQTQQDSGRQLPGTDTATGFEHDQQQKD
ncbi:MAG: RNA polymerase sigma factor [Rudaea sp.]